MQTHKEGIAKKDSSQQIHVSRAMMRSCSPPFLNLFDFRGQRIGKFPNDSRLSAADIFSHAFFYSQERHAELL